MNLLNNSPFAADMRRKLYFSSKINFAEHTQKKKNLVKDATSQNVMKEYKHLISHLGMLKTRVHGS